MTKVLLLLPIVFLTAAADGQARDMVLAQRSGNASLFLSAPCVDGVTTLALADLLFVRIDILAAHAALQEPAKWVQTSGVRQTRPSITSHESITTYSFALDFLEPGTHEVQLAPVTIKDEGGVRTLAWKPFKVSVTPSPATPDLKNLRPGPNIEEVASPAASSTWWAWTGAVVGLALLMIGMRLGWRRRKAISRTPEELAEHELARLAALSLQEHGRSEEFHTLLANIVRRYLERKYNLRARRQTTPEFLHSLEQDERLSVEQITFLQDFLRHCDLAKFAGVEVEPATCIGLLAKTREFLLQTLPAKS